MQVAYLLRIVLPDRPGSLGEVASALGGLGADILAIDVVERGADATVVDDVLLELPVGRMVDAAVSACQQVPQVRVLFLEPTPGGVAMTRDLEVVEAMTSHPGQAEHALTEHAPELFRFGWAVLLRVEGGRAVIEHASVGAPERDGFPTPWLPVRRVQEVLPDPDALPSSWQGTSLVAAPLSGRDRALVVGRPRGMSMLPSERARLGYLTSVAGWLQATAPDPSATVSRLVPGPVTGLDHLVLTVSDVERSVAWYGRALGLEAVTFGHDRRAVRFGNQKINFHEADGGTAAPVAARPTIGAGDLCFVVRWSMDEMIAHLAERKVPIEAGPVHRTGARGPMTSVYVRDPDGNLVELACYAG
jgi:catechol 2,3-dioxygenase-like lactoylglutathione lyase family enzyme